MKKNLIFCLLCIGMLFVACEQEQLAPTNLENSQKVEKDGVVTDTDPLTFEASLNETYTKKCNKPDNVDTEEFEIKISQNTITVATQNKVVSAISESIQERGYEPFAIDIDAEEEIIELIYDDDGVFANPVICSLNPIPDNDCYFFDDGLEAAQSCDQFEETDLFSPIYGGCDCTNSNINATVNSFSATINSNYPIPDNHLHWSDIQYGGYDGQEFYDLVNAGNYPLWDENDETSPLSSCTTIDCIDGGQMNEYYCTTIDFINQFRPTPQHEFISIEKYSEFLVPNGSATTFFWWFEIKYGISISCCDCCC